MRKGPSWRKSVRGFWRAPWVFIVASALAINMSILVLFFWHAPLEISPVGILGYLLAFAIVAPTIPPGWIIGLLAGPAIHGVVYRRLKQADDHYKGGVKAYEAEQPDEAITDLTKALDLSGGEGKLMKWDAHAYAYRAGAYAVLEDIGLAIRDLETAYSLTRDHELKAHIESRLQESREEIGHGGAQSVTRRGASVISRTGG